MYVVTFRRKYGGKDTLQAEFNGVRNAEQFARMSFLSLKLDRVSVVDVDQELDMYTTVYTQERNCKHLETQLEFDDKGTYSKCVACGERLVGECIGLQ